MRMPFGQYRGQPLSALPDEYFEWLLSIELREPLRSAVIAEVESRNGQPQSQQQIRPPIPVLLEIVAEGRRSLARQCHPDVGGDLEKMKHVNVTADFLEAQIRTLAAG